MAREKRPRKSQPERIKDQREAMPMTAEEAQQKVPEAIGGKEAAAAVALEPRIIALERPVGH